MHGKQAEKVNAMYTNVSFLGKQALHDAVYWPTRKAIINVPF